MSKYEILNAVATPKNRIGKSKYPFSKMKIGNAFNAGKYSTKLQQNISSQISYYKRKSNHSEQVFKTWKTMDGDLMVKRIK